MSIEKPKPIRSQEQEEDRSWDDLSDDEKMEALRTHISVLDTDIYKMREVLQRAEEKVSLAQARIDAHPTDMALLGESIKQIDLFSMLHTKLEQFIRQLEGAEDSLEAILPKQTIH